MKATWSAKWKKCFIWFGAYFSFIALAIIGGYAIIKSEDEALKKTTKKAFIVTLVFAALSAVMSVFYNLGSFSNSFYGSAAYDFYDIFTVLVAIAKIVVFAVFIIVELAKNDTPATPYDTTPNQEDTNSGTEF